MCRRPVEKNCHAAEVASLHHPIVIQKSRSASQKTALLDSHWKDARVGESHVGGAPAVTLFTVLGVGGGDPSKNGKATVYRAGC